MLLASLFFLFLSIFELAAGLSTGTVQKKQRKKMIFINFETPKVPPLIKFNSSVAESSCMRAEMRIALFLGQSQFLISAENVSGNCSELIIGWPSHPFPDIGEIKLLFKLDERKDALRFGCFYGIFTGINNFKITKLSHAGLRYIEVRIGSDTFSSAINNQELGAPLGSSFVCRTGFEFS